MKRNDDILTGTAIAAPASRASGGPGRPQWSPNLDCRSASTDAAASTASPSSDPLPWDTSPGTHSTEHVRGRSRPTNPIGDGRSAASRRRSALRALPRPTPAELVAHRPPHDPPATRSSHPAELVAHRPPHDPLATSSTTGSTALDGRVAGTSGRRGERDRDLVLLTRVGGCPAARVRDHRVAAGARGGERRVGVDSRRPPSAPPAAAPPMASNGLAGDRPELLDDRRLEPVALRNRQGSDTRANHGHPAGWANSGGRVPMLAAGLYGAHARPSRRRPRRSTSPRSGWHPPSAGSATQPTATRVATVRAPSTTPPPAARASVRPVLLGRVDPVCSVAAVGCPSVPPVRCRCGKLAIPNICSQFAGQLVIAIPILQ